MHKIKIKTSGITLIAELLDTPTARKIYNALPFESVTQRWGDELYFRIPVQAELEKEARDILEIGEIGYWPTGSAFCIFWGATPASTADEPRAASPVNIFGRIQSETSVLRLAASGTAVHVTKTE